MVQATEVFALGLFFASIMMKRLTRYAKKLKNYVEQVCTQKEPYSGAVSKAILEIKLWSIKLYAFEVLKCLKNQFLSFRLQRFLEQLEKVPTIIVVTGLNLGLLLSERLQPSKTLWKTDECKQGIFLKGTGKKENDGYCLRTKKMVYSGHKFLRKNVACCYLKKLLYDPYEEKVLKTRKMLLTQTHPVSPVQNRFGTIFWFIRSQDLSEEQKFIATKRLER